MRRFYISHQLGKQKLGQRPASAAEAGTEETLPASFSTFERFEFIVLQKALQVGRSYMRWRRTEDAIERQILMICATRNLQVSFA